MDLGDYGVGGVWLWIYRDLMKMFHVLTLRNLNMDDGSSDEGATHLPTISRRTNPTISRRTHPMMSERTQPTARTIENFC